MKKNLKKKQLIKKQEKEGRISTLLQCSGQDSSLSTLVMARYYPIVQPRLKLPSLDLDLIFLRRSLQLISLEEIQQTRRKASYTNSLEKVAFPGYSVMPSSRSLKSRSLYLIRCRAKTSRLRLVPESTTTRKKCSISDPQSLVSTQTESSRNSRS